MREKPHHILRLSPAVGRLLTGVGPNGDENFHSQRIMQTIQGDCERHVQGLAQLAHRRERFALKTCNNCGVEAVNRESSGPRIIL
jgi:hypothetical protein